MPTLDEKFSLKTSRNQYSKDISHLSPYHERVSIEKKYLSKKQQLRSILIMGHLQKMELNAINNRSMQTIMKAKKAEEMSSKSPKKYALMPEIGNLKINAKKYMLFDQDSNHVKCKQKKPKKSSEQQEMEQICEKLIDQYMEKAKQQNILQNGEDRQEIVNRACAQIKKKLAEKYKEIKTNLLQKFRTQAGDETEKCAPEKHRSLASISDFELPKITEKRSLHKHKKDRRSIASVSCDNIPGETKVNKSHKKIEAQLQTSPRNKRIKSTKLGLNLNHQTVKGGLTKMSEIECLENMKKIEAEKKFLSKQRMLEEKMFLRKMKMIGVGNGARFNRLSNNRSEIRIKDLTVD